MIRPNRPTSIALLILVLTACLASTVFADPEPAKTEPAPTGKATAPAEALAAPAAPAPAAVPETKPVVNISEAAQSATPSAVILMNADGVTYYRFPLDAKPDDKLAAWLVQRAPDAVARVAPDGSAILTRRDRRNDQGEIVQQLILVNPGDPATTETKLPLDTTAIAEGRDWKDYRLRSMSGLQWPLHQTEGPVRVLLRLTYEKKDADAGTPAATQELLGWFTLKDQSFAPIWSEPRLLGVEISTGGSYMHILALRTQGGGQQSGEGGDATALLLDASGKELPAKVLRALRTVGYLYRGWIDDTHLLLKRAGQNQLVVYDAANDTVAVPKGLDTAWSAGVAPSGSAALVWQSEEAVDAILPLPVSTVTGKALEWDTKTWGEAPLTVASWSADSRYLILLGKRNPRGNYGKVLLVDSAPFSTREIALPVDVTISAARFVYEPIVKATP